ncbi:YaaA family protein [Demequina muriae]|uniref:Peroxide stress protein YaaA n=1 Tax=Demequina muriae TaxID=3051664 RepID=A0ABT8GJQ5_9MICO|nr:peroxide stress protein YaaA [Demequina sp. EGI L300058]MDN4481506.1 peroxide stress protein YaaA [Demequina sp. EGI L300058]
MLILLPPSEGKTAPTAGASVDLAALSHPALASARQRVGDALAKVSGQRNALDALGVGPSLAGEVERNVTLWGNPADAAAAVYTGVLYDAAGMGTWSGERLRRAAERIRIISALWGAVSPADSIPAYRLSMSTSLGRIGPLASFWRQHLAEELSHLADGRLVVDCRSSSYVAAWRPTGAEHVSVRVERELNGRRTVVSHMAKHTRGLLAGALATADAVPESAADLADAARTVDGVIDVTLGAKEITLVVAG